MHRAAIGDAARRLGGWQAKTAELEGGNGSLPCLPMPLDELLLAGIDNLRKQRQGSLGRNVIMHRLK